MKKYDNNKTYVLSGQSLNQIADGINYVNEFRQADSAAAMRPYRSGEIRVFNPSSENAKIIPAYSCVILTGLRDNSVTSSVFTFQCKLPEQADARAELFAITAEPIHPGTAGRAVLDGLAVIRNLKSYNSSYKFLRPVFDGSGDLEDAARGNIRLLGAIRTDDQTDSRYLVQIGSAGSGGSPVYWAQTTGTGTAESGYNAYLYTSMNGSTPAVEDNSFVFLPDVAYGQTIPAGSWFIVHEIQTTIIEDPEVTS